MGVFKRTVKHKDGSKTDHWYIRYTVNGKDKWESVDKAGEITKVRLWYTHPDDSLKEALETLAKFSQTTTNIVSN